MAQLDSFTVDVGGLVCAMTGSVWPVFVCFCTENDENTVDEWSCDV